MAASTSEKNSDDGWNGWKKAHTSAVVIVPPEHCWSQIQDVRSAHDKSYERWMPHINLLYPFIKDESNGRAFDEAESAMKSAVADLQPFTIVFDRNSFRTFRHGKQFTLWLKPVSESTSCRMMPMLDDYSDMHESVLQLQRRLQETFPACSDLALFDRERGFTPHLSLGQFQTGLVADFVRGLRTNWADVTFEVTSVYIISRQGADDPFQIRRTIPLGTAAG